MTKLPEPVGRICFDGKGWEEDWVSDQDAYSEAQLKQYGDDRVREALEEAAAVSRKYNHPIAGLIGHEIGLLAKELDLNS
jgi:hypothetical protein